MISNLTSPQELHLYFLCSTFTAWTHQVLQLTKHLDEKTMRRVIKNMRFDVESAHDDVDANPSEIALLKEVLSDCEELVEHLLSAEPQALGRADLHHLLMPARYWSVKRTDTDMVLQLNIALQFLFQFVAQAIHEARTHGVLTTSTKLDLKAWCVDGAQNMEVAHLSSTHSTELTQKAAICTQLFLNQIA